MCRVYQDKGLEKIFINFLNFQTPKIVMQDQIQW